LGRDETTGHLAAEGQTTTPDLSDETVALLKTHKSPQAEVK